MIILVVNAGSSSLKYQLIDMSDESVIARATATVSVSTAISITRLLTAEFLTRTAHSPHIQRLS